MLSIYSKRFFAFAIFFSIFAISMSGCKSEKKEVPTITKLQIATETQSFSNPVRDLTINNVLEKTHQEYLRSYEKYVQMLREKGPQTMETLEALADYQKNYQLYQKILAEEKKE
ncbi:MAG: hypothetical protein HQM08_25385 [Candidatus Riflebacteria bacterium]|nr:hypothetical protein [Candidatus Riflebacteria bacterium]